MSVCLSVCLCALQCTLLCCRLNVAKSGVTIVINGRNVQTNVSRQLLERVAVSEERERGGEGRGGEGRGGEGWGVVLVCAPSC